MRGGLTGLAAQLFAVALILAGCGRPVERPAAPVPAARVVCASPAIAEIVFALGCGDRVVGVSEFTDWPPEAASKPVIGSSLSPNRERLLALEPDLILSQGKSEVLGAFAASQGIPFVSVPLDTLADVREAVVRLAAVLGAEEEGRRRLAEMDAAIAAIPRREPVTVFLALGHAPGDMSGLMTSGAGTFLNDVVVLAGGSNIFADAGVLWAKISRESLIRRQPALILDFQPGEELAAPRRDALIADWEQMGFSPSRIRILTEEYLLKPSLRSGQSAARIAEAFAR